MFVEKFANSIQHVHISDYTETRDCVVPFCENTQFDFQRFLRVMHEKGYTGDYIIELYENGYETPVDYTLSPPVIRVKIQKAFGTYTLPRVGAGTTPVLIHLCAPNGRAAQIAAAQNALKKWL